MKVIHDLNISGTLKIVQDTDLNSYTFDSVLLAEFTKLTKKTKNIVDLCAGNAPIAMLIANQNKALKIKAVELQSEVCDLAVESISENNMEEQIEVINDNLIGINKKIKSNFYDIVTCNPPYFRVDEASNLNKDDSISLARHEIAVNLEEVIAEASKLLNNCGVLTMVHRPERLDEIILLLTKYKFSVKRIKFVYPKPGSESNTLLIEATKKKQINNKMKIEEPFYVYDNKGEYTKQALQVMNFTI